MRAGPGTSVEVTSRYNYDSARSLRKRQSECPLTEFVSYRKPLYSTFSG